MKSIQSKLLLFLSIFLMFFSCLNNKKQDNDKITLNRNEIDNPIFLNMSPKMDSIEFDSIKKENKNLIDGKFYLGLRNDNRIGFDLLKNKNRITLEFVDIVNVPVEDLNKTQSTYLIEKTNKLHQQIIEIYKDKYGEPVSIMPNQRILSKVYYPRTNKSVGIISLKDYGFEKNEYLIFRDSIKSILIGYDKHGEIVLSESEIEDLKKTKIKKSKADNNLVKIAQNRFYEIERKELLNSREKSNRDYGIELEINYMHNNELDTIIKQIKQYKNKTDENRNKLDSLYNIEIKIIKNNKSKI